MQQSIISKGDKVALMIVFCLLFFAFISFPAVGRWGSFQAAKLELLALLGWLVWIFRLGWILSKRNSAQNHRIYFWLKFFKAVLASAVVLGGAYLLGTLNGNALRFKEIKASADAGLQRDCIKLMHNWPVKNDRIQDFDSEFSELPTSIKMLAPAYLENGSKNDPTIPPNIGLCKNGFGGFAVGIRVFQNDQDANKFISVMNAL